MRIPQWFAWVWVIGIGVIAVASSALSYTFVRDRAMEFDSIAGLPDPPQIGRPVNDDPAPTDPPPPTHTPIVAATTAPVDHTPDPAATSAPQPTADLAPVLTDPRRVSVLLMGIDQRAGETGAFPTDTMIVFSLDPVGKTAAILSIPRDLWVEYPGLNTSGRINGANILGDDISYPGGGGPAYAVRTVEKELGINIQYYVLINFEVFYTLVDAVGPIEVCPTQTIHDTEYPDGSYGYITVHFDPECQELDAERLLQYARVRHGDEDGDIGRSRRQQEVILNVRQKVLSLGGVTTLLPEIPALWESVQDNVKMNLALDDILALARSAESVSDENIRQAQISFDEVFIRTTDAGDEVLVPISSDIFLLVEDLFRPPGAPSTRE